MHMFAHSVPAAGMSGGELSDDDLEAVVGGLSRAPVAGVFPLTPEQVQNLGVRAPAQRPVLAAS